MILLVLNVWAFISIVTSGASTGATVLWIVLVLILPLFGFIIWLLFGLRARA